ncbi:type VII secretion target [Micromonosporaceae bacterium Da 78-11]
MTFTVEPDAVHSFAATVGGLSDDADAAVGYSREYLGIGYDKGRMFATVVETATTVREALVANYQALAKLADRSGLELDRAAKQYRETDRAAAGRIDATY